MGNAILVVEDEVCGDYYQKYLEGQGHVVMVYKDGQELLGDLENDLLYDIAVVDRSLPNVDGDVVIGKLKDKYPRQPVICTSAYGGALSRVARADAHLDKPFSIEDLEVTIKRILKQATPSR